PRAPVRPRHRTRPRLQRGRLVAGRFTPRPARHRRHDPWPVLHARLHAHDGPPRAPRRARGGGVMSAYRLRIRDDATGYGNFYVKYRGQFMGAHFDTRQDAEDTRRAMPNGAEFDVVEV